MTNPKPPSSTDKTAYALLHAASNKALGLVKLPSVRFRIPTPSTLLNCATGIGGLAGGTCTEIMGKSAKGKTSLMLGIAANIQRMGGWVGGWGDAEQRLDRKFAEDQGVNLEERFIYFRPKNLEEYLDLTEKGIMLAVEDQKKNPVPVGFFLDSVAALGTKAQQEGELDKEKTKILPMSAPQQWTRFWQRNVAKSIAGTNIYLVLANQVRVSVDFFGHGPPKVHSPGGSMLGYMDSMKIMVDGYKFPAASHLGKHFNYLDADAGAMQTFVIDKNSVGAPWREAEIPFFFQGGYWDALSCLEYLRQKEEISWGGSGKGWIQSGEGQQVGLPTGLDSYAALVSLLYNPDWVEIIRKWAVEVYYRRNYYPAST